MINSFKRSQQRFLQIKESFEFFDKKYNPSKYSYLRESTITPNENSEEDSSNEESAEESIRNKYENKENVSSKGFKYDTSDPEDYFRKESILQDLKRQQTINSFLNNRGVNPRSDRMTDRHNINSETIKRGKLFGPDDWLGFLGLTYLIYFMIMIKVYMKRSD